MNWPLESNDETPGTDQKSDALPAENGGRSRKGSTRRIRLPRTDSTTDATPVAPSIAERYEHMVETVELCEKTMLQLDYFFNGLRCIGTHGKLDWALDNFEAAGMRLSRSRARRMKSEPSFCAEDGE